MSWLFGPHQHCVERFRTTSTRQNASQRKYTCAEYYGRKNFPSESVHWHSLVIQKGKQTRAKCTQFELHGKELFKPSNKGKIDLQFFLCRLREESRVVINIRDSNMKKLLDLTVVFVVFLSSEDLRAPAWDWLIDNLLMRVREMESSRRSLFSAKPSRLLEAGRKMPTPWNKMADLTCTCF